MTLLLPLACLIIGAPTPAAATVELRGDSGVVARFEQQGGWRWVSYADPAAGREWPIGGPQFSLQTSDGHRTDLGSTGFAGLTEGTTDGEPCVTLEARLQTPPVEVRQVFGFCADGRTLRIRTSLRATGEPLTILRVGLLEVRVTGQALKVMGPENVSSPVFGDRIFAGIEHPAAFSQVDGDTLYLAQHSYTRVGREWVDVPGAVFGSSSDEDGTQWGAEALRRAFLRYLDTVRVKPANTHVHYNNWWTMPVPFTETDVLSNIGELKRGLYDQTGFFFDSYAMDMGWSDPHTVWRVDKAHYPEGFRRIREALAAAGSRPGLWVSPSSCYPPALDNEWLESAGYETLVHPTRGRNACLAIGGRYQKAFKQSVLRYARQANFAHVKFDGLVWPCEDPTHGHPVGNESFQPIAEGLMDIFDALRDQIPDIALEPTCLGYWPSPWWLMHTPYIIGPFGDDCPAGRCPCPEWTEALTTGRDICNLQGREAFLMPTSALECFDIVVQSPGDFQNHGVAAISRGHWFQSTYINPRFMDAGEWQFFADLMRWARAERGFLQDPVPVGGDPGKRQAYGYAYREGDRQMVFARNPWIEETSLEMPQAAAAGPREVRLLYPRRKLLGRLAAGEAVPPVALGPYELVVVEVVPTTRKPLALAARPAAPITWEATQAGAFQRLRYDISGPAYGPDWSSPDGDAAEALVFTGAGALRLTGPGELCVLVEGMKLAVGTRCEVLLDGKAVPLTVSASAGSFSATGALATEGWVWFLAPLKAGAHRLEYRVTVTDPDTRCGVFVRGLAPSGPSAGAFGKGPQMPLYRPAQRPWSLALAPVSAPGDHTPTVAAERRITRINGVYLDTLEWEEATAGWGTVHRNLSIMGNPLLMGGRSFTRGIGTHAHSRIAYALPEGYRRFEATIGCDQEVLGNSVVFVVRAEGGTAGAGKELYRSPLMRFSTPLIDLSLPVAGVEKLVLIVEDGGDGIGADHGDWAEARLLK